MEKLEQRHYRFLEEKMNVSKDEFESLLEEDGDELDELFNELSCWDADSDEAREIIDHISSLYED